MKTLVSLTVKILLLNAAVIVSVAWIQSYWYCFDLYLGAPQHQMFIHIDASGWYLDARRYPDMTISWGVTPSSRAAAETLTAFGVAQPNHRLIDRFEDAHLWDSTLPGIRWLSNSQLGNPLRGRQWGIGFRHWLLFTITMLTVSVWCWRLSKTKTKVANVAAAEG